MKAITAAQFQQSLTVSFLLYKAIDALNDGTKHSDLGMATAIALAEKANAILEGLLAEVMEEGETPIDIGEILVDIPADIQIN